MGAAAGALNSLAAEAVFELTRTIQGSGKRPADPEFKWVNTALGIIKSAITGTCRSIDQRHSPRYLAAFENRFNRRFDLNSMVPRLASVALYRTRTVSRWYQQSRRGNQERVWAAAQRASERIRGLPESMPVEVTTHRAGRQAPIAAAE